MNKKEEIDETVSHANQGRPPITTQAEEDALLEKLEQQ